MSFYLTARQRSQVYSKWEGLCIFVKLYKYLDWRGYLRVIWSILHNYLCMYICAQSLNNRFHLGKPNLRTKSSFYFLSSVPQF